MSEISPAFMRTLTELPISTTQQDSCKEFLSKFNVDLNAIFTKEPTTLTSRYELDFRKQN